MAFFTEILKTILKFIEPQKTPNSQSNSKNNIAKGIRSDQISCSVMSDSLQHHESQHARPPYPSPTPRVHSDSHPSSQWCHPAISSSVVPFSSCPQSFPASGSFQMSQLVYFVCVYKYVCTGYWIHDYTIEMALTILYVYMHIYNTCTISIAT